MKTQARRMWKMHQASEDCPSLGQGLLKGHFGFTYPFAFVSLLFQKLGYYVS